jgi:hypothetical protein
MVDGSMGLREMSGGLLSELVEETRRSGDFR